MDPANLILPISYLIASLSQVPGKLRENREEYGSNFRGIPREEQIYTILPMYFDELYKPRVFKGFGCKVKEALSKL
jgi:hypothetical protein